jgi:hypothetical protein
MKRQRIEKTAKMIILISTVAVLISAVFLAYHFDKTNSGGLLAFGFKTNLVFSLSLSCPVIFIFATVVSFIKELALKKLGEGDKKRFKTISVTTALLFAGIILYAFATSMTAEIAIFLGFVSVGLIVAAMTGFFIYLFRK